MKVIMYSLLGLFFSVCAVQVSIAPECLNNGYVFVALILGIVGIITSLISLLSLFVCFIKLPSVCNLQDGARYYVLNVDMGGRALYLQLSPRGIIPSNTDMTAHWYRCSKSQIKTIDENILSGWLVKNGDGAETVLEQCYE